MSPRLLSDPCPRCAHLRHDAGEADALQLAAHRRGVQVLSSYVCARGGISSVRLTSRSES